MPLHMREPARETLAAATAGDMASLDAVLLDIQPGVFHLALRMLGNRDDAADSTQEILLKVVIHLAGFRGASAFTTWVWSIARHHLLTARTRCAESPEVSLESIAERLDGGLDLAEELGLADTGAPRALTPEEKLEARQVAVSCTQTMLMALDREQRLVYILDTVFDLPSPEAAAVVGVSAAAYRQRLSRAKARLEPFLRQRCSLVSESARCRCDTQARVLEAVPSARRTPPALVLQPAERIEAERLFSAYTRLGDAAEVFRRLPQLQAPESMRAAIRAVLTQEGLLDRARPQ